ncbi:MAG: VOC family protein [Bacteroidales bacterium]|nr:VOC family protein [Bacteroidales bacterium]
MKIAWITIYVRDMEESLAFYTQILGMKVSRSFTGGGGVNIHFLDGKGADLELIHDPNKTEVNCGTDVSVGLLVDDLDATMTHLKEQGIANIVGPISPNPHLRFIFIKDPNGFTVQLVEQRQQ